MGIFPRVTYAGYSQGPTGAVVGLMLLATAKDVIMHCVHWTPLPSTETNRYPQLWV